MLVHSFSHWVLLLFVSQYYYLLVTTSSFVFFISSLGCVPLFSSVLLLPLGFLWYTHFLKILFVCIMESFFSSPSIMSSNFVSYFNLVWQLWSFTSWDVLFQALLDFKVSVGKPALIFFFYMWLLIFVNLLQVSVAFLYSLSICDVLTVVSMGSLFAGLVSLIVCVPFISVYTNYFLVWRFVFSSCWLPGLYHWPGILFFHPSL